MLWNTVWYYLYKNDPEYYLTIRQRARVFYEHKSKYKKVGVLPIRISVLLYIGNTPTFSYFDLYLYAAHYVIFYEQIVNEGEGRVDYGS